MSGVVSAQLLRFYAKYHHRANEAVLAAVPSAAIAARKAPLGFGSILATANHIAAVDELWLARLRCGGTPKYDYLYTNTDEAIEDQLWFDVFTKGGDWAQTRALLLGNSEEVCRYVEGIAAADDADALLRERCEYKTTSGGTASVPRGVGLLHLFNHATDHRGQIHGILTSLGHRGAVIDMTAIMNAEEMVL